MTRTPYTHLTDSELCSFARGVSDSDGLVAELISRVERLRDAVENLGGHAHVPGEPLSDD